MSLYEQAKDGAGWNPAHLDFSTDKAHWNRLQGEERVPVLALAVLGAHGLRRQWQTQSKLLVPIEHHGTIEESLCHSSHIFETARHVEFYQLLLNDIFQLVGDPKRFHSTRFSSFFGQQLPEACDKLPGDLDAQTLIEALTLTGPLSKGVLAATSRYVLGAMLERREIMPTTRTALRNLRQAAERHTEFETYFIGRLVQKNPALWEIVDETMHAGFEPAVGMVREFFDQFSPPQIARAEAVTFAVECFSKWYERLEKVKNSGVVEHSRVQPGRVKPSSSAIHS
jgi:ribonucleotide reductase beta subunit family protein with ferritin-like domain